MLHRAHLRAGGAALVSTHCLDCSGGASPRGRSSRRVQDHEVARRGRISARAEQPRKQLAVGPRPRAHLRAGGAAIGHSATTAGREGASPRGRSSLVDVRPVPSVPGRISARAEQPGRALHADRRSRAHLRAGGAAGYAGHDSSPAGGASPRGRSSRICWSRLKPCRGRISARAEQPSWLRVNSAVRRAHLRAGGAASVTGSRGYYQAGSPLLPAFPYSAVNEQPKRERLGRRSRAS